MTTPTLTSIFLLAEPQDAPALTALNTRAFQATDVIYPLIWGNTAPGVHDAAAMMLFNPMQSTTRVTWKVEVGGKIVGYARWCLPAAGLGGSGVFRNFDGDKKDEKAGRRNNEKIATEQFNKKVEEGWKTPAGMHFDLFMQKLKGFIECQKRDYKPDIDTSKILL